MNARRWVGFVWLVVAMTILAACVPIGLRGPVSTPESPPVAEVTGPIRSYRATLHQEIQNPQADGSTISTVTNDYSYTWQATDGPFGYDAHVIVSLTDFFSEELRVVDEIYAVDEFFYRQTAYEGAVGWGDYGALPRTDESAVAGGLPVLVNGLLDSASLARISGLPIPALLAQSDILGDEMIGGLRTTHYRLTDIPVLAALIDARLGVPPPPTPSSLKLESAQLDIWLGVNTGLPVQYTFQATGKSDGAGTGTPKPLTIVDDYSISEINSGLSVEVPAEILTAVKTQP